MKLDTTTFQYPTFEHALSIRPLVDAALPEDGPIQITYDLSQRDALSLHTVYGCSPHEAVYEGAASIIQCASELLRPFLVSYLEATILNDDALDPVPLDGFRAICGAQMLYAYACEIPELEGSTITVVPTYSLVSRGEIDAYLEVNFHVTADDATMADEAKANAVLRYAEWGRKMWGKLVLSVIGPWAVDSGIEHLRLCGVFVPQRGDGLEALRPEDNAVQPLGHAGRAE